MRRAMKTDAIRISGLSFSYPGTVVLEKLDFTVAAGEFVALLGHNGTGKSTLLKTLLGFVQPQKGDVRLFGTPITQFRDWHRVGYVQQTFENFDLTFPANVQEVASMVLLAKKGPLESLTPSDRASVAEALEKTGMTAFMDRRIGELSGGQQQRVFLARALAAKPELLLLDEPTTGVDYASQEVFYGLLRKLNREMGISILLISHDIGQILSKVDRVAVLNRRIVFQGEASKLTKEGLMQLLAKV